MREVRVDAVELGRLERILDPERAESLRTYARAAEEALRGRVVWNVNATATGGGVAEMLQTILAYGRGAGVDTRWLVLDGDPEFFTATKRLHNFLHGSPGDGGQLDGRVRDHYAQVLDRNLADMRGRVRPGDLVLLHDPQTAGLVAGLREAGVRVLWRCHVGRDDPHPLHEEAWEFLRPFLEGADGFVFSRREYVPRWMPQDRVWIVPPSLDPFSAKNAELSDLDVAVVLRVAGLVAGHPDGGSLDFPRRDGETGQVRPRQSLLVDGDPVPGGARVVLQVSRWDRLKDMAGVLRGFVDNLALMPDDAHLLLAGPDVLGVTDDPEGAAVLEECRALRRSLPDAVRGRVHLTALPMDDIDENAHLVNALQRHASVVVQKSLMEGFGLTVTEPMWKYRAVVASAVGGILDQIEDGASGVLLPDPADTDACAAEVARLLADPERAHRLGVAAHARVQDRFLGDRHLIQYAQIFATLV
ncbi:MAG TPA: glycosyltransferase [Nocardioides sp.]|nr:glycosyltransferase [Nocardioides sp.]